MAPFHCISIGHKTHMNNETKGIQKTHLESDQYSLQTILVNQDDRVVVNLYNMEAPSGDIHLQLMHLTMSI